MNDPAAPAGSHADGWVLPRLTGPDGRVWHALLADDNPVNREVGIALLQQLGLTVQTAVDGHDAVRQAAGGGIDLVLMDLQMPRLDGLAATRAIRALPVGHNVPVIAMTASAFAQDRTTCLDAGMNDFVAKPVDIRALASTLARWLPGAGA
jgi:two-component system, sensor histidine kinase and response regulator